MPSKEITSQRKEYIKGVKSRLNQALVKSKLSISALIDQLENSYGLGLNKNTLSKLFNENDISSLDYACLVTVCHFFGFDFNKILTPAFNPDFPPRYRDIAGEDYGMPKNTANLGWDDAKNINPGRIFIDSLKDAQDQFLIFSDEGYSGAYTGYYFPDRQSAKNPKKFTLTMTMLNDGTMQAELFQKTRYKNPRTGKKEVQTEKFKGVPIYVKAYSSVMILMTSDKNNGECWLLAFAYEKYNSDVGLIYRYGLMLTGESIKGQALSAESFLLFNNPVTKEKQKYLPGLLKAPNRQYTVPIKQVEELAEKDPDVKAFIEEFDEVLKRAKNETYLIHEDNILTDKTSNMDKFDRIKALLMLKTISTVADVYHFRAKYRYTGFAVNYLAEAVLDEFDDGDEEDDEPQELPTEQA